MIEIRIHGRGGQGSVTAANLIAQAAFLDGKNCQAFPNFGVERKGAPVVAYARISDKFIQTREQIYAPDFIIIQDETLLLTEDITKGVKDNAKVIINTEKERRDFNFGKSIEVITFPATKLALEILKKNIVNTALLGAFSATSGLIKVESVIKAIKEEFIGRKEYLQEPNIELIKKAFSLYK